MAGFGRKGFGRAACAAVILMAVGSACGAAKLDGVALPDTAAVGGSELRLNGIALRTYSWLRVRIYVAGLYVEQPTHDAEAILDSSEKKMLLIRFMHDVDVENARKAWRDGFAQNCRLPCRITPEDEARFLSAVPPVQAGDRSALIFTSGRLTVMMNERTIGVITNPVFERAVLATFIGPKPPTEGLKRGLLGGAG